MHWDSFDIHGAAASIRSGSVAIMEMAAEETVELQDDHVSGTLRH
jgi:hypothetical protein